LYVQAREESPNPETSPILAIPVPFTRRLDFGTTRSLLEPNFLRVSNRTKYAATLGYGWLVGSVSAADRRVGTALDRDLNQTRKGTFVVDVPNGTYTVNVRLGDAGKYAHDQMQVTVEGVVGAPVTTAARELVWQAFTVTVADGQMTVGLLDLGGKNKYVAIEGLTLERLDTPISVSSVSAEAESAQLVAASVDAVQHNALTPFDVNGDTRVTALDMLLVVNHLNQRSAGTLPQPAPSTPPVYLDVDADGLVTPRDALVLVNQLNRRPQEDALEADLEDVLTDIAADVHRGWESL